MGVDQIIVRIRRDTDEQIGIIRRRAEERAADIIQRAEKEGSEEYNRIIRDGERRIARKVAMIRSQASLEARQMIRSKKEELISECFTRAREQLAGFRESPFYRKSLRDIILKSVDLFEDDEIIVVAAEKDRDLVGSIVAEMREGGIRIRVGRECVLTAGGVILKSANGRLLTDQTYEARMERQRHDLMRRIAGILFGDM
ncbi:MAG: V-type ATP synthase subunit E [Methanoculleaceae archaeon]